MRRTNPRILPAAVSISLALAAACGGTASPPAGEETPPPSPIAAAPPASRPADAGAPSIAPEPAAPDRLEIALTGADRLSLVEYLAPGQKRGQGTVQLDGKVAISITNPSAVPVRLVHMDPANLVFTRVDSGARFSLFHPCDPGLLVGRLAEPVRVPAEGELRTEGSTVFTLGPGATRAFEMGADWGCSGGPWQPVPEPGEHRVAYRIRRLPDGWSAPEPPAGATIRDRLEAARAALASDRFWDGAYGSEPVTVVFGAPRARRLGD
jgi:hypothetical protein